MRNFTMTETSDSWTELWKPAADTKLQTPRSTSLYGKEDDSLQKKSKMKKKRTLGNHGSIFNNLFKSFRNYQ